MGFRRLSRNDDSFLASFGEYERSQMHHTPLTSRRLFCRTVSESTSTWEMRRFSKVAS